MIKTAVIFTISLILTAVLFSCGGGGGGADNAIKEVFTISYNANGAEYGVAPAKQSGDEDSPQEVQANTGNLSKSGYLFDGWNTAADGSGTNYAPGSSYKGKNVTLYAKWAAIFNVEVINPGSPAPALNGAQQRAPGVPYIKIIGLTAKGRTLVNINIPSTIDGYQVASIGSGAFQNCDFVTELIIPETVSNIENNVFTGCTGLSTLTIPRSVTSIGDGAFSGCAGLNSLILLTATPPAMGTGALEGTTAAVSVPAAGVDAYKAAEGWNTYSSSIAGYSTETYTVTFDGQGATKAANPASIAVEPPTVTVGQLPTPPEKSGFGFEGWYMEPEGAGGEFTASTVVTGNITVYAKWNQNYRYTVRFDDQGATTPVGEISKEVGAPNTTVGLLPSEPANNGYIFGGWNTESDGTGNVFTANTVVSNNITVYAKWIPIFTYTIENSNIKITALTDAGKELSSIVIPDTVDGIPVTIIGSNGYVNAYKPSNLTSLTIGRNVITIDSHQLFTDTLSLNNITVDSENPNFASLNGVMFNKNKTELLHYPKGKNGGYTIPNGVTSIGLVAFSGCTGLTNITIPNTVTDLSGFSSCTGLTNISIPSSVTTIGMSAFYNCTGLTNISIPNSVTTIGNSAFSNCTGLATVTIGSGLTSIGERAFEGCTSLTTVNVESNSYTIGSAAFAGCSSLSSLPNGITFIGGGAFGNCTSLINITIPNANSGSFANCTSLTNVTVNGNINNSAFSNCTSLTNIVMESGVGYIGSGAFYGCSELTTVTVRNTTPPNCANSKPFMNTKLSTIRVPAEAYYTYYAAQSWLNYAELIVADE